jgi:hypothetical protein
MKVAYVAVAIHIYCKCTLQMFYLFQTYAATLASARNGRMRRRYPRAQWSACARQAKQAWVVSTCMCISRHEAHNCVHRRTSMRGWVCRHNSCMQGGCAGATVACGGGRACGAGIAACVTGRTGAADGHGYGHPDVG